MRLRDLPRFSSLYLDFLEDAPAARSFLARLPTVDSVRTSTRETRAGTVPRDQICRILESHAIEFGCGDLTVENLRRLAAPNAAVIVTRIPSSFGGGPLFEYLKCLSAAKLAAELDSAEVPAIPVCYIDPVQSADPAVSSLNLLDSEARLCSFSILSQPGHRPVPWEQTIAEIGRLLGTAAQRESLEWLSQCYTPQVDVHLATGRYLAGLFRERGVVFIDGRAPEIHDLVRRASGLDRMESGEQSSLLARQYAILRESGYLAGEEGAALAGRIPYDSVASLLLESILPVAARIVDEHEIQDLALLSPIISRLDLPMPRLWPRASGTILDTRSRKIIEKYELGLLDLFQGCEGVLRKLADDNTAGKTKQRLELLASHLESGLMELKDGLPLEDELAVLVEDSRDKMTYQVRKLKDRFAAASQMRGEVMGRQIDRVCNSLAPAGSPQELKLAGLYFILRYSPVVLRILFDSLDIRTVEHQLIPVE